MSKPNKDGWIRHRGGKCPVDEGAIIDVRYRDGSILCGVKALVDCDGETEHEDGWDADFEFWDHDSLPGDIMAWRPHKPSILDEPVEPNDALKEALELDAPKPIEQRIIEAEQDAIARYADDPRTMRDRIREIDAASNEEEARHCAAMAAYDAERTYLVAKLKAEGFVLVEPNSTQESAQGEPGEDMSDPANWRRGDILECINGPESYYTNGKLYEFIEISTWGSARAVDDRGTENGIMPEQFKWHSRPTP